MIDQLAAAEDTQIIRKDKMNELQRGMDECDQKDGHSRMQSLSLSESKVMSIRNNSIYQDYRFQHMSVIGDQ